MASETTVDQAKIIGERIRKGRKALGLTRDELAEATGLAKGTIERVETGRRYPEADHIIALCPILKMSPNMLLVGSDAYDPGLEGMTIDNLFTDIVKMTTAMSQLDAVTRKVLMQVIFDLARSRVPDDQLEIFNRALNMPTVSLSETIEKAGVSDATLESLGSDIVDQISGEKKD